MEHITNKQLRNANLAVDIAYHVQIAHVYNVIIKLFCIMVNVLIFVLLEHMFQTNIHMSFLYQLLLVKYAYRHVLNVLLELLIIAVHVYLDSIYIRIIV